jgi:hypothetical protein
VRAEAEGTPVVTLDTGNMIAVPERRCNASETGRVATNDGTTMSGSGFLPHRLCRRGPQLDDCARADDRLSAAAAVT